MDLLSGMRHLPSSNGFRDRKIVPLNPRHLGFGDHAHSQLSYQLHPPYQFRHCPHPSSGFSLPIANGLPTALHALVVRCARQML